MLMQDKDAPLIHHPLSEQSEGSGFNLADSLGVLEQVYWIANQP